MGKEKIINIDSVIMKFNYDEEQALLVCSIDGQLETSNSPHFLETMQKELENGIIEKMILDLTSLTYVSSTGIGTFTTLLISCKNKGVCLILKNMSPKVKSIFDLLGFSSFFTLEQ